MKTRDRLFNFGIKMMFIGFSIVILSNFLTDDIYIKNKSTIFYFILECTGLFSCFLAWLPHHDD